MAHKIFFLGIDGATWKLLLPWIAEGKLPAFRKLFEMSQNFFMQSTHPPYTACAWPTMFTGLTPAEHGHYDFRKLSNAYDIEVDFETDHLAKHYLWYHLSKAGYKTCVFNLPMTYPATPINGAMISGFNTPSLDSHLTYPKTLKQELLKTFPAYHIWDIGRYNPFEEEKNDQLVENLKTSLEMRIQVANWLSKKDAWDAIFVNFQEVDFAQHFFWKYRENPSHKYASVIIDLYKKIDKYLANVIELYKDSHKIFFASDHGFGPSNKIVNLNYWLEEKGYLHFKNSLEVQTKHRLRSTLLNPKFLSYLAQKLSLQQTVKKVNKDNQNTLVRKIFLDIQDIDWDKTKAFSFGQYGGIHLVDKTIKEKLLTDITKDFATELTTITDTSELYQGNTPNHFPDLHVRFHDYATTASSVYAFAGSKVFDSSFVGKSGEHRLEGCLSFTSDIKQSTLRQCSIYDMTPTLLANADLRNLGTKLTGKNLSLEKNSVTSKIVI